MKKALKIALSVFLALFSGVILLCLTHIRPIKLGFTEKITLNYVYGAKNIHVEITDPDDFVQLISICKGRAVNDYSLPSCGFGTAELIFEGNGKSVILYPACDGCNTMRLGEAKFYYGISAANRKQLVEILAKYGATFPCV